LHLAPPRATVRRMRATGCLILVAACGHHEPATPPASAPAATAGNAAATTPAAPTGAAPERRAITATPTTIQLPGAGQDGVSLDYLAYDAAHHRVWIPAGGTGKVDVIDATTNAITPIEGFPTKEVERRGQKRMMGPSSAAVGDGFVYIGNRADSTICAINAATLVKGECITLPSSPDGLQYVAATKELWVTTPRDQSLRILDVKNPAHPVLTEASIKLDEGGPEGFAVDNVAGVFYTNIDDHDATTAIDIKTRKRIATYVPGCGEGGGKGLAFEPATKHLIVACTDRVVTLDTAHNGARVGDAQVGEGIDAVDYVPSRHAVFAAAARAEKLTIVALASDGKLSAIADVPTAKGARNAVATEDGTAYVADGPAGSILVYRWPL
jgi:DNA-binding beta-propeller fold protein YncE